jgi:hypothetical protein
MYITSRYLCFYSNLFGLEKKIRIPFSHIKEITKENTALVIPNALAVTTFRKEYLFRSFWDRDECFQVLRFVIDKQKDLGKMSNGQTLRAIHGINSPRHIGMPLLNSEVGEQSADMRDPSQNELIEETKAESAPIATAGAAAASAKPSTTAGETSDAGADVAIMRRLSEDVFRDSGSNTEAVGGSANGVPNDKSVGYSMDDILDEGNESAMSQLEGEFNDFDDPNAEKNYAEEAGKARLGLVFASGSLPISARDFWNYFVEDEAPYSVIKYVCVSLSTCVCVCVCV